MNWLWVDVGLFAVLVVVWLAAAPFSRRTVRRESRASRLKYMLPAIVAGVLLSGRRLGVGGLEWLDARVVPVAAWVGPLSAAVTAAGVAFAIWARATLGRNWSGTVTLKQDHELIERGPYAIVRHPIYTGFVVAIAGIALELGTVRVLIAVVAIAAAFALKLRVEERFLGEQFGAAHDAYRRRVRALVPYLW
jgi:protein-S-isoprenylcysteine O-methyltransferase Ste14